jgi:hypothetical protein
VTEQWRASIPQADLADWLTVTGYLLCALLSFRAAWHAARRGQRREKIFWRTTSFLLLFLAGNELLDLQTLLTSLGRAHAKTHGWYEKRRIVQFVFILTLCVAAALAGLMATWVAMRSDKGIRLALAGLVLIGLFVLLRAASFHHLDELLGGGATIVSLGVVQEIGGILVVAAGAAVYNRSSRAS